MGKGNRNRAEAEVERLKRQETEKKEKAKKRRARLITGSICGTLALAVAAVAVWFGVGKAMENNGTTLRGMTAISSDHYKVNGAMMTYFAYEQYQSFAENNADSLSSYGLDTAVDIKEQNQSEDKTWFEYFLDAAKTNVSEYLALCEAAKKAGVTLSDTELADIESAVEKLTPSDYGKGVNEDDIRDCYKLRYLASSYYGTLQTELAPSAAEIDTYFAENGRSVMTYDYSSYTLTAANFENDAAYRSTVDSLKNTTNAAEFSAKVRQILVNIEGKSEEETETTLSSIVTAGAAYSEDDELSDWAYDSARKIGDTKTVEDDTSAKVYMMTSLPVRDETATVNVRHILFKTDTHGTAVKAKTAADEVYNTYLEGDKTEDAFAALAQKYSEDTGSVKNGGLYKNVAEGKMVTEFNDWCFDPLRTVGDTGIVETSYGAHIMYFSGAGYRAWQTAISDKIFSTSYTKKVTELKKACNVTENKDNLKKLRQ